MFRSPLQELVSLLAVAASAIPGFATAPSPIAATQESTATRPADLAADARMGGFVLFVTIQPEPPEALTRESRQKIEAEGVRHVAVDEGGLAPGYFDKGTGTFYRWRGILLNLDQDPFPGPLKRVPLLDPSAVKRVVLYEMRATAVPTKDGHWELGCYDRRTGLFYRWKQRFFEGRLDLKARVADDDADYVLAERIQTPVIDVDIPPFMLKRLRDWEFRAAEAAAKLREQQHAEQGAPKR
ncbi:MAG: hypothetical protein JWL69_4379 [Phycisphaerales bacterium]|nr:hypothetical protein [Phycisphaerales bacterium]